MSFSWWPRQVSLIFDNLKNILNVNHSGRPRSRLAREKISTLTQVESSCKVSIFLIDNTQIQAAFY